MAETMEPHGARVNPLSYDLALFDMYMSALDAVVAEPEIRNALEEFRLSPHALRGSMISAAHKVLQAAPSEFAAYEEARTTIAGTDAEALPPPLDSVRTLRLIFPVSADDSMRVLRLIGRWLGICGLLFAVAGAASFTAWPWTEPLLWSGMVMVAASALAYGFRRLDGARGIRLLMGDRTARTTPRLDDARDRLMTAITHDEFLAQARTLINTTRQDQFGHAYSVASIAGLSEIYDSTYQVPTGTAAELEGLLTRLDGASIGVAGPRGSGKSTLIRGYCEDSSSAQDFRAGKQAGPERGARPAGDLRCMVAAPVDYAARDFVLHLFATFCRSVIRRYGTKQGPSPHRATRLRAARGVTAPYRIILFGISAAMLLRWQQPIASFLHLPADWVFRAGVTVALLSSTAIAVRTFRLSRAAPVRTRREDSGSALVATARRHLSRVRYLQTRTSGWSGTLGISSGSGQFTFASARAEQPLSYPEIVSEFRSFARHVAADVHRNGGRAFIGIDELDKIGTPEQAERFLNEIKGILGIPHVYFMVSVSDDALTAFERRGLPLRDAFDSSFDEIIHVGPLSYAESRRLLYRRVIGLTEPYVALCHCLAGGLPRDLIRAARLVIRTAETLTGTDTSPPDTHELSASASTAYLLLRQPPAVHTPVLSTVCAAVVREELRRKARAVAHLSSTIAPGQARDLQDTLSSMGRHLVPGEPVIKTIDAVCQPAPGEPDSVTALRLDMAAYAYYCATLEDVFTDDLDLSQLDRATTPASPGSFDALAAARQAFTLDPHLAWHSITQFRQAWSLETREPPAKA